MRTVGIGETVKRDLDKIFLRAAEDQLKFACRNMKIYAGLESVIVGANYLEKKFREEREDERKVDERYRREYDTHRKGMKESE